jgi:hypothetical protein
MKVSAILFSLLLACQALPVTMHAAAAQSDGTTQAGTAAVTYENLADHFGPERVRIDYQFAVARLKLLAGKPLAYTYDYVTDSSMALTDGNALKSQGKISYAYDKEGRSRTVSTMGGLERIVIADPTKQVAYLVCPERREILRVTGAALEAPPPAPPQPDKSGVTTDLGTKTIAGVNATGSRTEVVVPAGAQGNEKPLVHKFESWYSPDLATMVYMHMSMPEYGDTVMHVENLRFGDVPASTFALPEGYAVRDMK